MNKKKAILLDRDGVLIEDKNYAYKIEDFELLPGVIDGLKLLNKEFLFFIVTNQSGIGRSYYTIQDFHIFNNHLLKILKEEKINILKIINEFKVDIKRSWMIGDHPSDIQFGIKAGCSTIFLTTGHGDKHISELESLGIKPTLICDNFLKAAKNIVNMQEI